MIAEMPLFRPPPSMMFALQWGRDQMIAEIYCHAFRFQFSALLQWGRDQMIAEIPDADNRVRGPVRLQWGRDQMIAEILHSADRR